MSEPGAFNDPAALRRLLDLSRQLGECADLDQVLTTVIDALRDLLHSERATVFVHDAKRSSLVTRVAHGLGTSTIRVPDGHGIAGACAQSRQVITIADAYLDERFDRSVDAKTGYRTRTILAVPLLDDEGGLVGVAQVLNRHDGVYTAHDELVARSLAAHAAVAVRRATLIEDRIERLRLQEEIDVARAIQQQAFPTAVPILGGYELFGCSTPSAECGGDAFDLVPLRGAGIVAPGTDAERVMLLIADATGHGVGPALSSMQTRGMMRLALRLGQPLGPLACQVNQQLLDDLPGGRFVTAWFALLDPASHTLHSFSAGQGPLFVYRRASDAFEQIDTDAPPMGIMDFDADTCATQAVPLAPGDLLVAITDGYYEAPEAGGGSGQFGEERVFEIVRRLRDEPLDAIVRALDAAVLGYHGAAFTPDDRTAILVRRCVEAPR